MKSNFQTLGAVTGLNRTVARAANVLGVQSNALARPTTIGSFLSEARASAGLDVEDGVGTLVGAAAGAYWFRKRGHNRPYLGGHPILGGIAGASLGRNLPALLKPAQRGAALRNLIVTGAGIAASLYFKKRPVVGFVGGAVAGGVVTHFVGPK